MALELALYRKHRPKTFAEMIGQDHVTEPLSQALRAGRLHHAYLFSGPRGCGKTTSARILARSLNCEQGPTPDPCGECESCRALGTDGAGSIDVIEIDAASHGGVDDARDLRERAFFTPVAGRYKIYIIDEAHMVSSAGFNALLKLVEEPPDYVKFVFATTEPEKVLPTIKSRTHHYPFRLVPPGVIRPYLEKLCEVEGVAVEPAVFPLVVRAGGGSVRDTLSVLDQLIAGGGPDGVGYPRAVALLGVTDAALLDEVGDALVAGDGAAMFAAIDQVAEAGHDPRRFAADLLERLRDLIVLQQVPDAVAKGLLDAPADQLARMSTHASQLGPATLSRCAEIVHNGLVEMRGTASPRLLLELVCARMLLPGADESSEALLHRLERLERRLGATGAAPEEGSGPVPPPSPAANPASAQGPAAQGPAGQGPAAAAAPAGPAPAPPAAAPRADGTPGPSAEPEPPPPASGSAPAPPSHEPRPGSMDAAAMRRVWDEVVATVGRRSKRAAAVVREATVRDVQGDTVVLQFQHAVHATMLSSSPQQLLDAVREVLGGNWQLRCEARDAGNSAGTGAGGATGPAASARPAAAAPPPGASAAAARAPGGASAAPPPGAPAATIAAAVPAPPAVPAEADWPEPVRPGAAAGTADEDGGAAAGAAAKMTAEPADLDDELDSGVDLDGDERTDVGTSEQQALDLLQQTLGAEKIGEVAP